MIKTILTPYELKGNISFFLKRKYLSENGYQVYKLSTAIKHFFKGFRIANLNFYESMYSDNYFICIIQYAIKVSVLYAMKICNVRIIYTMHNKVGHDSKYFNIEKKLMKKLCILSDSIVILCSESKETIKEICGNDYYQIEKKITKIPLISYEDAYPIRNVDIKEKYGLDKNKMIISFIGAVRKYKNIELIIECAKKMVGEDVEFVIAGAGSEQYIQDLSNKIKGLSNIKLLKRFISDDEMADFANAVDVFILPYDITSSLNSGTCMYAFSFGRNVICPRIGTIKELDNQVCYSYVYSSEEEHMKELLCKCYEAYYEWKNNKEVFIQKQEILRTEVRKNNSYNIISNKYKELYERVLKGEKA